MQAIWCNRTSQTISRLCVYFKVSFDSFTIIHSIEKPTPVQSYAIPLVMEKKNVFVKAETGSGKTLAFLMPILFNLSRQLSLVVDEETDSLCHPRCIIVAPTRELAIQIHRLCYRLTKVFTFIKCSLVVGGINKVLCKVLLFSRLIRFPIWWTRKPML